MTEPFVRTVLGDVLPEVLGRVNYHEHLFQVSPLLPGEELADEELSRAEAVDLVAAGTGAMVEATPTGLGRRPDAVARISRSTGLHVVHVTGAHRAAHYGADDSLLTLDEDRLAERFIADIADGFAEAPGVRAGVVKAGIEYWNIPAFSRRVLTAAATAARITGAPLMVHLEHGSAAHELLDLLEAEGIAPSRVALAHVDRNPDPLVHADLAARGARLGYDGWARHRDWPDSMLLDCLTRVVGTEAGRRAVILGGDVARASRYLSYGGIPGLGYVARRIVPQLEERLGVEVASGILHDNPASWLTFAAPSPT
ncbi:aryldialkylphosphatase [Labedella phragmitis]|uniref:Aryldialkylphosphatase n=1 Tax=Labedella phragmitis TaxID=2498849 RepID=A0A444PRC0_9MICO|nr:aryldialkylphosphatase [Labedella phragmitis]RWZ49807.1 aryldialkylphosphatase [Labedella phragmitis]